MWKIALTAVVLIAATACSPVAANPTPSVPTEAWVPVSPLGGALIDSSRYPSGATIEVREDYRFPGDVGGVCLSVTEQTAPGPPPRPLEEVRFDPIPGSTRCSSDVLFRLDGGVADWTEPGAYKELGEVFVPLALDRQVAGYDDNVGYPFSSNPVPLKSGVHYYGASFGTAVVNGQVAPGGSAQDCLSDIGFGTGAYPGGCLPDSFVIRW